MTVNNQLVVSARVELVTEASALGMKHLIEECQWDMGSMAVLERSFMFDAENIWGFVSLDGCVTSVRLLDQLCIA